MRDVNEEENNNIENSSNKNHRIFVKVTKEEKIRIEDKAKAYGYRYVSDYVRDACINEKVYIKEVQGREEIANLISNLIKEVQLLRRDHRYNFRMNEVRADDLNLKYAIEDLKKEVRVKLFVKSKKIN